MGRCHNGTPGVPVFPRIERWPDDLDQFLALRTLELVGNPVVAQMLLGIERPWYAMVMDMSGICQGGWVQF